MTDKIPIPFKNLVRMIKAGILFPEGVVEVFPRIYENYGMRWSILIPLLYLFIGCSKTTQPPDDGGGFQVSGILLAIKKPASTAESDTTWNIYTLDPSTGDLRMLPISTTQYSETTPVFSDGYLYFASNQDGDMDIYRANPETGEVTRLIDMPLSQSGPTIAQGGNLVAFNSEDGYGAVDVIIYDVQNGTSRTLGTPGKMDIDPFFVNDTLMVLILQDFGGYYSQDIWLYNLSRDTLTILESTPNNQNARPCVSPDGSRIAFVESDLYLNYSYLYVADFPTMENRTLILGGDGVFVKHIAWSPDSRYIAASVSQGSFGNPANTLYIVDVQSGDARIAYQGNPAEYIVVKDWE